LAGNYLIRMPFNAALAGNCVKSGHGPGWRGRLVKLFLGRELRRGPEESLQAVIRAAEG
jgi:hypothetical protein